MRTRCPSPRTLAPLAGMLLALCPAAQKQPDVRLDTDPAGAANSHSPQIAASGTAVYVTWQELRNGSGDIYFNRSLDGGATWLSSDVRIDTDPAGAVWARWPRIAASGPAVHVTWENPRPGGGILFNTSPDGGTTWLSSEVQLSRGPSTKAKVPQIAVSGSSIYVTWQDTRNGAGDIYFNRSTDGGATWLSSDVRLDTDPAGAASSVLPQIAASGSSVYVTWEDRRNGADSYFNRSLDGGATWLADDVQLNTTPGPAGSIPSPEIAASGSSVFVTWEDSRNRIANKGIDVFLNYSPDSGTTWLTSDIRLNTNPPSMSNAVEPEIAASGSSVYVTWQDGRNRADDIFFSRSSDGGATWSANVQLDADETRSGSFTPKIAASGSSVGVTWSDERNGSWPDQADIYCNYSTDRGATWLSGDVRLDTDPLGGGASFYPEIAASGSSVYVTWEDRRSSPRFFIGDVYFNIPYGFQAYGAGTAGAGGLIPQLRGNGPATRGNNVSLDVDNAVGGALGGMFVGAGTASKISFPLLGGTVLVSPSIVIPFGLSGAAGAPGAGTGSVPMRIPGSALVQGFNTTFQAVFLDGAAPGGVSMTGAVEMWIGS